MMFTWIVYVWHFALIASDLLVRWERYSEDRNELVMLLIEWWLDFGVDYSDDMEYWWWCWWWRWDDDDDDEDVDDDDDNDDDDNDDDDNDDYDDDDDDDDDDQMMMMKMKMKMMMMMMMVAMLKLVAGEGAVKDCTLNVAINR